MRNLSFNATDEDLADTFSKFGALQYARIIKHQDGRPRGFGFVRYENFEHANVAMDDLNGTEFFGRELFINKSVPQRRRPNQQRQQQPQQQRDDFW